jgi:hypothetical protein
VRGFAARVSAGTVHVKEGPFGDALIDQLIAFPAGRFDDLVDCCSLIGRALDVLMDGDDADGADDADRVEPFTRRHIESLYHHTAAEEARRKKYYD